MNKNEYYIYMQALKYEKEILLQERDGINAKINFIDSQILSSINDFIKSIGG